MSEHIRHFLLVRDSVGEATAEERQAVAGHLESCAACRQAAEQLRANSAEYDAEGERHFALIRDRLPAARPQPARSPLWRRLWPAYAGAVAVAAGIAFVAAPPETPHYKGELAMRVVAKRGERQFVVRDGQQLVEGDALRFVVTTGAPGYLTLFSVDGRGVVTPFYPEGEGGPPLSLGSAGPHELPDAVELDDAGGEEVIIAVLAPEPFSRAEVHEAFRRLVVERSAQLTASAAGVDGSVAILRFSKPRGPP